MLLSYRDLPTQPPGFSLTALTIEAQNCCAAGSADAPVARYGDDGSIRIEQATFDG